MNHSPSLQSCSSSSGCSTPPPAFDLDLSPEVPSLFVVEAPQAIHPQRERTIYWVPPPRKITVSAPTIIMSDESHPIQRGGKTELRDLKKKGKQDKVSPVITNDQPPASPVPHSPAPLYRASSPVIDSPVRLTSDLHAEEVKNILPTTGVLCFTVEDKLFEISPVLLQDCSYFAELFLQYGSEPMILPGVTPDEMELVIRLLDARVIGPVVSFTFNELTTLLRLGTIWKFAGIRNFAIKEIDTRLPTDPVDRIELAMTWSVDKWLEPAFVSLCTQQASPTAQQLERLSSLIGWSAFAALMEVMMRARVCQSCYSTGNSRSHRADTLDNVKGFIQKLGITRRK